MGHHIINVICVTACLVRFFPVLGQNMVNNHSFEEPATGNTTLNWFHGPDTYGLKEFRFYSGHQLSLVNPSEIAGTPIYNFSLDIPNNYFGIQNPYSGEKYVGLITSRSDNLWYDPLVDFTMIEYGTIGTKLNSKLLEGNNYTLLFYISKMDYYTSSAKFEIIVSEKVDDYNQPKGNQLSITGEISDGVNWIRVKIPIYAVKDYEYLFFRSKNSEFPEYTNNAAGFYLDEVVLYSCLDGLSCSKTDGNIQPIYTHQTVTTGHPVQIDNLNNTKQVTMQISTLGGSVVYTSPTISCNDGISGPIYWDGKNNSGFHESITPYFCKLILTNDCGTFELTTVIEKILNYTGSPVANFQCNTCNVVTPEPCCTEEPDINIDNITICGPSPEGGFLFQAVNNINIGPNVTITDDADVTFYAGNEIAGTQPQNVAVIGSHIITAELIPCPSGRLANPSDNISDELSQIVLTNTAQNIEQRDSMEKNQTTNNSQIADKSEIGNLKSKLRVIPNPSESGVFNLQMSDEKEQITTITVYNVLGEKVYKSASTMHQVSNFTYPVSIDISIHPKGIYFIKIQNTENMVVEKIIYQ